MKEKEDITKEQLIRDLIRMRSRIAELERVEVDRRKYHEELTRTKAMYEGLFEFAPDAVIVVGKGGEIVRVNNQAEKLFGYSKTEFQNNHIEDLLPERFRERHKEHRRDYMSAPRVRPMGTGLDLWARKKDGSEFSVDIALGPLNAGDEVLVMAVIRDVTKHKLEQEALAASEKRYHALFDAIDEGFCIIEVLFDETERPVDFRYIEINPVFEQQTGLKNVRGKTIRELVPGIEEFWVDIYGKVAIDGESTYFSSLVESIGRWFDVFAFRIGEPHERKVAVLFRDITERRRYEANLAFLAEIDRDLARLRSADDIIENVGLKIGAYMKVQTVNFA